LLKGSALLSSASILPALGGQGGKILACKSDTSGVEWVPSNFGEYSLQRLDYGKVRILKDFNLINEVEIFPTPTVSGRYLKYENGGFSWAAGTTSGGSSGDGNDYVNQLSVNSAGTVTATRTNGSISVDLTSAFYTKSQADSATSTANQPLSNDIETLQASLTALTNTVTALNATVLEGIAARNLLAARVTQLENTYATQTDISAHNSRIQSLEIWCGKLLIGGFSPFSSAHDIYNSLPTVTVGSITSTPSNLQFNYSGSYLINAFT